MTAPIAFVSRYSAATEAKWVAALSEAMPQETIRPFSALSAEEKQQVEIAIAGNPDPAEIAAMPNLKWLHSIWAGVDTLVAGLGEKALPIVRLVDPELTRRMAEAVLAWTCYLQRDMPAYRRQQMEKKWRPLPYRPPSTLQVGVLGLGVLGQAAAKSLHAAGFQVAGWSRSAKSLEGIATHHGERGLITVLQGSDIVVLLLPLTAETRGLMNRQRFAAMKKRAALINFARGPVLEEPAMLDALASGHLSHAVLDVFRVEPLPETSPCWLDPNVTVLPHIAALTTRASAAVIVAGNIAGWRRKGVLPPVINMQRGY